MFLVFNIFDFFTKKLLVNKKNIHKNKKNDINII